jgi:hypothetical protein
MKVLRLLSALVLLSTAAPAFGAGTTTSHSGRLPFVDDDYARAIRDARARGVPVFVEAWAPW